MAKNSSGKFHLLIKNTKKRNASISHRGASKNLNLITKPLPGLIDICKTKESFK